MAPERLLAERLVSRCLGGLSHLMTVPGSGFFASVDRDRKAGGRGFSGGTRPQALLSGGRKSATVAEPPWVSL